MGNALIDLDGMARLATKFLIGLGPREGLLSEDLQTRRSPLFRNMKPMSTYRIVQIVQPARDRRRCARTVPIVAFEDKTPGSLNRKSRRSFILRHLTVEYFQEHHIFIGTPVILIVPAQNAPS